MTDLPSYRPIGIIRSPFLEPEGTPIQPVFAGDAEGRVEVFPPFAEGLCDLEGFERIWLLYHLHRAAPCRLVVTPFLDDQPHGVFAVRSPARPNAIGLSCVRLIRRDGTTLFVAGIDVIDGTPLWDIKPYVPRFDAFPVSRSGWFDEASGGTTRADGRFSDKDT